MKIKILSLLGLLVVLLIACDPPSDIEKKAERAFSRQMIESSIKGNWLSNVINNDNGDNNNPSNEGDGDPAKLKLGDRVAISWSDTDEFGITTEGRYIYDYSNIIDHDLMMTYNATLEVYNYNEKDRIGVEAIMSIDNEGSSPLANWSFTGDTITPYTVLVSGAYYAPPADLWLYHEDTGHIYWDNSKVTKVSVKLAWAPDSKRPDDKLYYLFEGKHDGNGDVVLVDIKSQGFPIK